MTHDELRNWGHAVGIALLLIVAAAVPIVGVWVLAVISYNVLGGVASLAVGIGGGCLVLALVTGTAVWWADRAASRATVSGERAR